jgi:hypothetical protein
VHEIRSSCRFCTGISGTWRVVGLDRGFARFDVLTKTNQSAKTCGLSQQQIATVLRNLAGHAS